MQPLLLKRHTGALLRKQHGLTLVELMIALTLGLVLLGGIIAIMMSSRQTYRVNEALSRMQDSARYAFQVLSRDIRMAGYFGCVGSATSITNTLNGPTDFLWDFGKTIIGYEATSATAWNVVPDSSIISPLGGTDIIVVRGVLGDGSVTPAKVVDHPGGTPPGSANLKVGNNNDLAEGDVVMVSDCLGAAVFQITNFATAPAGFENVVHNTGSPGIVPGNLTKNLGQEYTGGEVLKVSTRSYFIRTNATTGRPALYRRVGTADAEELVEGVENMQILYGEDTNGNNTADVYRKANAVTDWAKVVSVRLRLLMQTIDNNVASEAQPYTYNDVAATTPTDRRLRQVYSTVIALRNRAP